MGKTQSKSIRENNVIIKILKKNHNSKLSFHSDNFYPKKNSSTPIESSKQISFRASSSTTSITSVSTLNNNSKSTPSINVLSDQNFRYLGGRKYLIFEDGRYLLPFDDDEHARLQLQHFIFRHIWNDNFSSPIHELLQTTNATVLDIGCGTGAWTLDMATDYPFSKFTGIDIFPIYPSEIKPKNVEFEIANVLNGLPYEDGTFDFVFMRFMNLTFTPYEWENVVIKELVRVVKPGGWIEIMERDPLLNGAGPAIDKFNKTVFNEIKTRFNIDPYISPHISSYMSSTQKLGKIFHIEKNMVIGENGDNLSKVCFDNYKWFIRNCKCSINGTKIENFDTMLEESLKEFKERRVYETSHRYFAMKEKVDE